MRDRDAGVIAIDGATKLPAAVGGKALGLAEISRAGLAVPAAWVVLPGADGAEVAALGEALRRRGLARVAVRSSAGDEDGAQHSFAGIHDSELGVTPDALAEAIARVASSPLSERAAAYRHQHGLPAASGPCAVVVQALVDAEWAGVAFGKGEGVLVEAVEGLGEAAVNGDATPEQLELSGVGGRLRVTRRWPRKQPFAVRVNGRGTARVALEGERPTLPEAVALEVAAGVAALEKALAKPLDVEWAACAGRVQFLQARPQTRPLEEVRLPPGEVFIRTNVRELVPELVTALSTSLALVPLDGYFRDFNRKMGVPVPDDVPLVTVVAGRAVLNERVFFEISDLVGLPRSWQQVLIGGPGEGTNGYVAPRLGRVIRHLDVLLRLSRFYRGAEEKAARHLAARGSRREGRAAIDPRTLLDEQLIEGVRLAAGPELREALDHINFVLTSFNGTVSSAAMLLAAHPAPAALLARLLDPEALSVTTRQVEEQLELAAALRGWDGAAAFLGEIGPAHAGAEHWRRSLPAPLWEQVATWIDRYGHRGPYESELALPRVSEDLRMLAAALRPLVLGAPPEPPEARRARRRADVAAAWREVVERCGRFAAWRVRGRVEPLGRLMRLREELRSDWMKDWALLRRDLLELGRRVVERGRLDAPEEVFHLDRDELVRALREPAFDARTAVARARARMAAWRRLEVPNRFTGAEAAALERLAPTSAGGDALLRGTAVSPGTVEGRACVLRSPDDEARMARGGILVAPATDPGWTPLFARAAGVVVELGGVMSHAATVARELGLPCVSNVEGVVAGLRDGDLLRVDGTHGTVEVLERAKA